MTDARARKVTERERGIWRTAITLANNLCVQRCDRIDDEDGSEEAMAAIDACCERIKGWAEPEDDQLLEMFAEAGVVEGEAAPAQGSAEAEKLEDLLCPPHANLDRAKHLEPFDNCIACIRVERDELRQLLLRISTDIGQTIIEDPIKSAEGWTLLSTPVLADIAAVFDLKRSAPPSVPQASPEPDELFGQCDFTGSPHKLNEWVGHTCTNWKVLPYYFHGGKRIDQGQASAPEGEKR